MSVPTIRYNSPGPTVSAFLASSAFVRAIRGPIGSAKSSACCIEIVRRSLQQQPDGQGRRRTRWAVIRNTAPELRTTTIKTWRDWVSEASFGKMSMSPPYTHNWTVGPLPDGSRVESEVIFLALDTSEDVKKLLSLELTGAWINEARELPLEIVHGVTSRLRRFPAGRDGGPTWTGLLMDSNSMDDTHWWPIMAGDVAPPEDLSEADRVTLLRPRNWEFFTQPSAMLEIRNADGLLEGYRINPDAENVGTPAQVQAGLKGITPTYYEEMIPGKPRQWIEVYVLNRLGMSGEHRAVFPEFSTDLHVAREPIQPIEGAPVLVGMDFGLTPACVFAQRLGSRWLVIRELTAVNSGTAAFAPLIQRELATHFPGSPVRIWGDPAGDHRAQSDESTPFNILRAKGLSVFPAPTNDWSIRREAVAKALTELEDGKPRILVSPACRMLRQGMSGRYCYPRIRTGSGGVRYADVVDKGNAYSHVCDALQYVLVGGGEGAALLRRPRSAAPQVRAPEYSVWDRQSRGMARRPVGRLGSW